MRKCDFYKNMNRNSALINHFEQNDQRSDTPAPNILMGQIWMQEENTQVEIIELDSDDSDAELDVQQDVNFGNIWNYLDKERFATQPNYYLANQKAREKRRMQYSNNHEENSHPILENGRNHFQNDEHFTGFYDFTNDLLTNNVTGNHKPNCFTIINKPFNASDSSSDDIEYNDRLNTPEDLNNGSPYDGEIVTFDEGIDATKRTIWIYSFRNKRVLSDNDFELVNIPSRDSSSSTSCSLDNFGEGRTEVKHASRVPSPIPPTYVPKLNLSQGPMLPTVTEITEPIKNDHKETPTLGEIVTTQKKCINNWLESEVKGVKSPKKETGKQDKSSSTNVINWMCLSPRERRRRFKHTTTATYQPILPVLTEVPSSEPVTRNAQPDNFPNKIQITAEINTIERTPEEAQTQTSNTSLLKCKATNDVRLAAKVVEVDKIEMENDQFSLLHKPRIVINVDRTNKAKITDPLEKLHSNNWIRDDAQKEISLKVYDGSDSEVTESKCVQTRANTQECAGKKLWVRNMSLLKPVEWSEFMPITDSVPSLHLSIASDSTKQTWLSRLVKCFRCFK